MHSDCPRWGDNESTRGASGVSHVGKTGRATPVDPHTPAFPPILVIADHSTGHSPYYAGNSGFRPDF